jgi:two-component system response regulator
MERRTLTDVLLVEDNPADVYVIQRVLADREDLRLWVMPDGIEALLFLRKEQPLPHVPTPALILLDLKLPRTDGAELLPQIRRLPDYQTTPIVILSSAPPEREELRCLRIGATAYVRKSTDFDAFCAAIRALVQRWLPTTQSMSDGRTAENATDHTLPLRK